MLKGLARWIHEKLSPRGRDLIIVMIFLICLLGAGLFLVFISGVGNRTISTLWALACQVAGNFLGFLFGIPRVLQSNESANPAAVVTASEPSRERGAYRMQVNTNLEQISDWVTKILVGLGLMELRHIPEGIQKIAAYFAAGAGNSSQVQIFAAAITVYFSVVGFLSGYLLTRIYVAGAFSRADQEYPAVHENSRSARI